MTPADSILVFLHIPKTGGLTMERIISRQYPQEATLWLSLHRPKQVAAYRAMSAEARSRLRCIMGHFPLGFYEDPAGRPLVHAAILREPVARFISEYHFLRRLREGDAWHPPAEALDSLEAYLEYREAQHAMNLQTHIIGGFCPDLDRLPVLDPLPPDALDTAIRNLRTHFAVVGVTERFDEALLLMQRRLGWTRRIDYARRNVAPQPTTPADLPPALLERLQESTRLDRALVIEAERLLSAAVAHEGAGFQDELAALKRRNHRIHLVMRGWKSTPLGRISEWPGIRQLRHLIGTLLARFW